MALQFSTTYRNYMLNNSSSGANILNALLGSGSNLLLYDNSAGVPANCAAAATGNVLATIALGTPESSTEPFAQATAETVTLSGLTITGTASGGSAATPGYFRLETSGGTTHVQGTAGIGSGDLSANGTITSGQTLNLTGFTITAPGA
jgi:hypothetical protein